MRSTALPAVRPSPAAPAVPAAAFPTLQNAPFAVTYAGTGPHTALAPPLARPIPISMGAVGLPHLAASPIPTSQLFNVSSALVPAGSLLPAAWGYGAKFGATSPVLMAPGAPVVNLGGLPLYAGGLGHLYDPAGAHYA